MNYKEMKKIFYRVRQEENISISIYVTVKFFQIIYITLKYK